LDNKNLEDKNMGPKRLELKNYLKELAVEIREYKDKHKEVQRQNKGGGSKYIGEIYHRQYLYRHHHIAYSELRGKTREQIEKPKENNKPNEKVIEKIKKDYFDEPQALCVGA
jgi:hypothetical protein